MITVDIKESDLLAQARALFAQEEVVAPVEQTPTEEVVVETTPVAEAAEVEATPEAKDETTTEETK